MSRKKYTIAQFKRYLESQQNTRDMHRFLSEENVEKANEEKDPGWQENFYL